MNPIARGLIVFGIVLIVAGLVWQFGGKWIGGLGLGRLPGDISIERPGFKFYFPLATSLLLSALLSLLLYIFRKISGS